MMDDRRTRPALASPSNADAPRCECGVVLVYRTGNECQACRDKRTVGTERERLTRLYSTACTYDAAHARVRKARGRPTDWRCARCGNIAEQWAYVAGSPREIRGMRRVMRRGTYREEERVWSPDPADYIALCRPCHGHATSSNYGPGIRHDPAARADYLARQRAYHRQRHTELRSDPVAHDAYRARKRAEYRSRKVRENSILQSKPDRNEGNPTHGPDPAPFAPRRPRLR